MSVFNILELCGDFLFDFVLPLKERAERTKRVTVEELSLFPKEHELFGETVTTILDYREPAVRDAIQALKYDNSKSAAKLLGGALADFLAEEIAHAQLETSRSLYLVPMPLHESRMRERGFNQTERVVRALPNDILSVAPVAMEILLRERATDSQTKLSRSERIDNVRGAFGAAPNLKNFHLFLLDDVVTTGATLIEATRTLKRAGASVSPIALARA